MGARRPRFRKRKTNAFAHEGKETRKVEQRDSSPQSVHHSTTKKIDSIFVRDEITIATEKGKGGVSQSDHKKRKHPLLEASKREENKKHATIILPIP